ncbi:MAG: LuxR C-terminal-related transcriptional regulator [Acidobacteriota bacterium]|nr:LuxR C-terminal-related transcriptional regulator [Acidobacteriota bacterium]
MSTLEQAVREPARLAAVRKTNLLDTPPEECFDRLTRLAAETLGVHAAFLSLVDERSDFYKSCFGFGEPIETTRRLSGETFCHHALIVEGLLIIDDAREHPTYASVPTVKSLGVVAYLGVPLHSAEGETLGSFALIDIKPRRWSRNDITTACLLARAALREIELRARQAGPPAADPPKLSTREREVMLRLVAGQRPKEIASDLNVSVKTIATHRQRLLRKLNLEDNRALYRYALRQGLLDWTNLET